MDVRTLVKRILVGSPSMIHWVGGIILDGGFWQPVVPLVYGAAVAVPAGMGTFFTLTVTDGSAFVLGAPTGGPTLITNGELIYLRIVNASGGALGAGTFNAAYKVTGNVPAIANGFNRTIAFQSNGAVWTEVFRTAADVPN
jgi:hypothetical protein